MRIKFEVVMILTIAIHSCKINGQTNPRLPVFSAKIGITHSSHITKRLPFDKNHL